MTDVLDRAVSVDRGSVPTASEHARRRWPDVVGVAWVILAGLAVLLPAMVHGGSLGSYDWLSQFGLTKQPAPAVLSQFTSDQIRQMIPWTRSGLDPGASGPSAPVEPQQRPRHAPGLQLAVGHLQCAGAGRIPGTPAGWRTPIQVVMTMAVGGTGAYVSGGCSA